MLKCLCECEYALDEGCCEAGVRYGQLDMLKYLSENFPCNELYCTIAAKYGRLPILQYLSENRCPVSSACSLTVAKMAYVKLLY